jgi:hypothetical protein
VSFLASLVLPFAACVALSVVTARLWWASLQSPWTYLLLAILSLLGLHRLVQALVEILNLLGAGRSYFLVARRDQPGFWKLVDEAMTVEAVVVTGIVLVAGYGLLLLLRSHLPKA